MRDLWLIGIGTGNPAHVTLEAQAALREAALVLVPRKGDKSDLADLRHAILKGSGSSARTRPSGSMASGTSSAGGSVP